MNKCKRCGVFVEDQSGVCPLCDSVLQEIKETAEEVSNYPNVGLKTRKLKKICQIGTFLLVLIEILLIVINYYTPNNTPWSMITGGAILYLIITVRDILNKRTGHIRKIYLQVIGLIALIICIDCALGFSGWSLEYGFPIVIYGINLTIILCMIINYANWQNYLVMQIFVVILSGGDMILYLSGVVKGAVLPWIALGVSSVLLAGTVVFGERKATNELKRKFHI